MCTNKMAAALDDQHHSIPACTLILVNQLLRHRGEFGRFILPAKADVPGSGGLARNVHAVRQAQQQRDLGQWMTVQVLVTGGAGFIGAHVTHRLLRQGCRVRVFDNFSTGRYDNLQSVRKSIEIVEGDVQDAALVRQSMRNIDLVVHLAALVSVTESIEHPLRAQAINATGTLHVLEAARAAGVQRMVQASSCAVYGDPARLPISEDSPLSPLSPYAVTKLAAEQLGQLYTQLYSVGIVALRFFNVYGPGQDPASPYAAAIPRFIATLRAKHPPTIFGDGLQTRDFIYVSDVVEALWLALHAPNIAGKVFNIGRGEACRVIDLVRILGEILGTNIEPQFVPLRKGEVLHSQADARRFTKQTGFNAAIELRQGLELMIAQPQDLLLKAGR
jgi:nucleoside-diphosphate-sugar epimerase